MEQNKTQVIQFKKSHLLIGGLTLALILAIISGVSAAYITNQYEQEKSRLLTDLETANRDITDLQSQAQANQADILNYKEQLDSLRTERAKYKTALKLQLEPTPQLYLDGKIFTTEYVSNTPSMEDLDMTGAIDLLDVYLNARILSALDTENYYYFSLIPAEPLTEDESSVYSIVYSYNKETRNLIELYSTENNPANPSYIFIQNANQFGLTLHSIGCEGCDFVQPEVIMYSFALQKGELIGQALMAEVLADGAYRYKEFISEDCPPNDPNRVANCFVKPETLEFIEGQIE